MQKNNTDGALIDQELEGLKERKRKGDFYIKLSENEAMHNRTLTDSEIEELYKVCRLFSMPIKDFLLERNKLIETQFSGIGMLEARLLVTQKALKRIQQRIEEDLYEKGKQIQQQNRNGFVSDDLIRSNLSSWSVELSQISEKIENQARNEAKNAFKTKLDDNEKRHNRTLTDSEIEELFQKFQTNPYVAAHIDRNDLTNYIKFFIEDRNHVHQRAASANKGVSLYRQTFSSTDLLTIKEIKGLKLKFFLSLFQQAEVQDAYKQYEQSSKLRQNQNCAVVIYLLFNNIYDISKKDLDMYKTFTQCLQNITERNRCNQSSFADSQDNPYQELGEQPQDNPTYQELVSKPQSQLGKDF